MWTTARGPSPSRKQGRDPPCRPGLRGVRVQDIGAPCADEAPKLSDCADVRTKGELSLQGGERLDGDPQLVGHVLHRLLAGGEAAGDDDDLVAAPLLLPGELEHVERCPADIQPGDHVHDPHASGGGDEGRRRGSDAEGQPEQAP